MDFQPKEFTIPQLLSHYTLILDELRTRGVIRTANSPIGDYAEWLVSKQLGLLLVTNSTSGYDAVDSIGTKYQIKSRRITPRNKSTQLSAIRNLMSRDFDYLIVVVFNSQIEVEKVVKIPHEIINKYAKYRNHVNAHILYLRENIINDPLTEDITRQFRTL